MSDTAFQTQYRAEYIASYEQNQSLLRTFCTTESVIKGNTAVFLVAGSGGVSAVTRGVNGLIPARADSLTQNSCTLSEWHDLVKKTNFNVFASQGNQRQIMQRMTQAVLNRKVDDQILTELDTCTLGTSAAGQTASLSMVMHALAILGNNAVPLDGNIFAAISPAFHGYLMQTKEFANVDYVNNKPFSDMPVSFRWAGVNFVVHPNISGAGTATEKCFMWHRSAIGHAIDVAGMETPVGYDAEQAYSWARASANMGAKLLQNTGIVQLTHDGSGFASVAV